MNKYGLCTGWIVECGDGSKMMVFKNIIDEDVFISEYTYMSFDDYTDDLKPTEQYLQSAYERGGYTKRINPKDLEIVKVYIPKDVKHLQFKNDIDVSDMALGWERYKKVKMSISDIEKRLGFEIELTE